MITRYSSPWLRVYSGVRQGDPMSPSVSCLYINDLNKISSQGIAVGNGTVS